MALHARLTPKSKLFFDLDKQQKKRSDSKEYTQYWPVFARPSVENIPALASINQETSEPADFCEPTDRLCSGNMRF